MDRYLVSFDAAKLKTEEYDVVIIGSGIAGVYTALKIDPTLRVCILTKENVEISNSVLAQGGIAVSLDKGDSPQLHFKDTIFAGAGLCEEKTVWALVNEAAENIESLCSYGVNFDRGKDKKLAFSREAAHSKKRIIHTGDSTGREVCDVLLRSVKRFSNVQIHERTFAVEILTEGNMCVGVLAYVEKEDILKVYVSSVVVCASGGFGQLYLNTTNPEVATGDGAAMCYRAGAELMDLEFIQFHPTVLYHPQNKSFLISEAVRGEGAYLRNAKGRRFMSKYHEMKELAPRDIVSRAIFEEMIATGAENVYLDITHKEEKFLKNRFPTIYKTCLEFGINIAKDYIPVAPAEHYCMGGIRTDEFGRTNIKGLYACGEAACNGIHGANRLASNSLLEGLVFGRRIGNEISYNLLNKVPSKEVSIKIAYERSVKKASYNVEAVRKRIQEIMSMYVGIIRNKKGLLYAFAEMKKIKEEIDSSLNDTIPKQEVANMAQLALLVIKAALIREESRGAHYREDFPTRDDINWKRNIILHKSQEE